MSLSSLQFIFIFLPLAFLLYCFIPQKYKYIILFAVSLLFYAWGGLNSLWLLLACILFTFVSGLSITKCRKAGDHRFAKISFIIAVAGNVLILCLYKYVFDEMPIGISFFTFSELSYLCDIYLRDMDAPANPLDMALYVSFFPKVTSGPIVQFKDFKDQIHKAKVTSIGVERGAYYIIIGLFKKVLLADRLGAAFTAITSAGTLSVGGAWLGMIFYSLQLYFDFAGYSDMAIGVASLFGYNFKKNFDRPYTSENIQVFWRKWHISLGEWFRDYVYIPLGGNRGSTGFQIRNMAVVWILTGIWHGNSFNFVLWGLWHLGFILLYRFVLKDAYDRLPRVVRILLTDLVVFVGWVFFFSKSAGASFSYLGTLFYSSAGFFNGISGFVFAQYFLLLAVAIVCCTGVVDKLDKKLSYQMGKTGTYCSLAIKALLLLFCIAEIVSSTYQTFLYFQF
ncbi:MAG: MBOAT family protein [Lachnospiraceae bacterium]|nr:MBOAT family protein [Lachnospiraceae bacterium]